MEELFPGGQEQVLNDSSPEVPESEARQVRELLQALVKTKRAFEMYPSNNPILVKFQEDLLKRFESFFAEYINLTLTIHQQDIFYKGASVYHNAEKDDNLALLFYKDGLRELNFTEGFVGDEVMDFLDVIRTRPEASAESFDDDIVTLMWEKDFVHLSYYIIDQFMEGEVGEGDGGVEQLLSQRKQSDGEFASAYSDATTETDGQDGSGDVQIFSPLEKISIGSHGIFSLGEEEVKSLKEEMEGLTDEEFLEGAIYVLFESLYLDKGTPDFGTLMDNLDSALNYLVYKGGFATAALILKRFRELTTQRDIFSTQEVERIRMSILKAGSETRARSIADILNSGREFNNDDFRIFLGQLDRNAILPLSNLLGDIQEIRYRKILIEVLVVLGRDNIDALAAGLRDRRWFVVRNVALILGRIGDKTALDYLKQALSHPEPKVRREIVRSLGMVGGPKAGEILLHAVEDTDPQIRMVALRYIPAAHGHSVLENLVEIVTRADFGDRALAEKRVFFEVLAEIGQDRVMPFMIKLLKKKSLFGSSKNDETRTGAAYGLGNIHQKEALEALTHEYRKAKKGTALSEALSYSIQKLTGSPAKSDADGR